jgi:hypothetical protein
LTNLEEKNKKYKICISKIARHNVGEEIKTREKQELTEAITEMDTLLEKIPDQEIIKAVRESKDQL